uniref:Fork-head domain-containing protein n=1 Tax=Mola mola TaxID=94237 RepID=A0A3Q3VJT5_MOLML
MTLQLKSTARLFDLHCSVGLTDWDMDRELKLATTTDQFYHGDGFSFLSFSFAQVIPHKALKKILICQKRLIVAVLLLSSDTFVKPNLWLLVNPNIACPIQFGELAADPQRRSEPAEEFHTPLLDPAETQAQPPAELHLFDPHNASLQEELLCSTSEYMVQSTSLTQSHTRSLCGFCLLQDFKTLKPGCWPRPPVNYCILIALALKSSHTGSLKVQQIYHFTRENFPFFQTAPDGWKNTIRHNLCFNSSFRKTCNQLCRDGKRKSCFWHLTPDGHRRLKDEIGTLPVETFKQLERSMSHPDVIRTLLAL